MHLMPDTATQAAAINTIRELIDAGLAGNDVYDPDRFVVDPPAREMRDNAEVALDCLGATFLRDNGQTIECLLPRWVRAELRLDGPNPPEMIVPLASRGVRSRLDRMIDEAQR
jgi:hypothetical protein